MRSVPDDPASRQRGMHLCCVWEKMLEKNPYAGAPGFTRPAAMHPTLRENLCPR